MEEQTKEKKKRGAQKGRVMSEAQREGLKKGFEALKAKRENLKKEKENKVLTKEPDLPIINHVETNNDKVNLPVMVNPPVLENQVPILKKSRNRIPPVSRDEFNNFKNELFSKIGNEKVVEKVIEKPIEKVVEKIVEKVITEPKILSGSALLNSIFFR